MYALTRIWDAFVAWLPDLLAAIVILIIGWIIAVIIKAIARGALRKAGLNRRVEQSREGSFIRRISDNPAASIGNFFYWLIMIITITIAIGALKIPVLTDLVNRIYGYVPNLLGAIFILILAFAFSGLASTLIDRWAGDTPTGRVASAVVPVLIMSIAGFAVLEQLKIAPIIITSTYIAAIGAAALGSAIAFGLGGQEAAKRVIDQAYQKSVSNMGRVREDVARGSERAREDVERVRNRTRR